MVTSIFLKKTWPSFCSSYIQILYFRGAQIDSGQCSFYICALTLKSFNVVLLDCNEPLLSAMRCSWKTLFSRLCVFSFDIVRSLLLVSIELQRDREEKNKHLIFDKWTTKNDHKLFHRIQVEPRKSVLLLSRSFWLHSLSTACHAGCKGEGVKKETIASLHYYWACIAFFAFSVFFNACDWRIYL